jgi:hypothetical protein
MRALWLALALAAAPWASREAEPPAAAAGESYQFKAEWRLVHAGDVKLSRARTESGWEARLQLKSAGLVSMLYRVDDLYLAQLGENLCAIGSMMNAHEGPRQRETKITYDPERRKASYLERDVRRNTTILAQEIDIPPCVHEIVGGLYRLRSIQLPVGKSTEIALSDGKRSVMARVEAQQQESIQTPAGRFKTIRYEAFLFNDVLYRRSGRLHVWLTDDERRAPVQIRARLGFPIGTITLQLVKEEAT